MWIVLGSRARFAIEVGEEQGSPELRTVDIWAGGQRWTCEDDTAFVPQLVGSIEGTLRALRSGADLSVPVGIASPEAAHREVFGAEREDLRRFRLGPWGPTTDNLLVCVFRAGQDLLITFRYWRSPGTAEGARGAVFVVRIPEEEWTGILEEAVSVLRLRRGVDAD